MHSKNRDIEIKNRQAELIAMILQNSIDNRFDYLFMLETLGEGEIDRLFWTDIFVKYAPQIDPSRIDFDFAAPPRRAGVQEIRKYLVFEAKFYQENPEFGVCMDSDCYYLIQDGLTQNKRHVLQTYTYSVENHTYSPSLLTRWVQEKYQSNFDFTVFLYNYSCIIYDVFLYWVHLCRKEKQNRWKKEDWIKVIDFKKDVSMLEDQGAKVCQIVNTQIQNWKNTVQEMIDYQALDEYVRNLGVKPEECFWYINGHALEQIINQILGKIRLKYVKEQMDSQSNAEKEAFVEREKVYFQDFLQTLPQKCLLHPHLLIDRIGKSVEQFFQT